MKLRFVVHKSDSQAIIELQFKYNWLFDWRTYGTYNVIEFLTKDKYLRKLKRAKSSLLQIFLNKYEIKKYMLTDDIIVTH